VLAACVVAVCLLFVCPVDFALVNGFYKRPFRIFTYVCPSQIKRFQNIFTLAATGLAIHIATKSGFWMALPRVKGCVGMRRAND